MTSYLCCFPELVGMKKTYESLFYYFSQIPVIDYLDLPDFGRDKQTSESLREIKTIKQILIRYKISYMVES